MPAIKKSPKKTDSIFESYYNKAYYDKLYADYYKKYGMLYFGIDYPEYNKEYIIVKGKSYKQVAKDLWGSNLELKMKLNLGGEIEVYKKYANGTKRLKGRISIIQPSDWEYIKLKNTQGKMPIYGWK